MSSYEEARLARVKRNAEVLKNIGLENALNIPATPSPVKRKRKTETRHDDAEYIDESPVEKRVSSRIKGQLEKRYEEPSSDDLEDPVLSYPSRPPVPPKLNLVPVSRTLPPPARSPVLDSENPDSSRNLNADVENLVLTCLGQKVPTLGSWKESCYLALCPSRRKIGFNKYAGISEFRNCLVLFLNLPVDGKAGGYDNQFTKDATGRWFLDFFASEKQSVDTPVVARLRRKADQVVLFIRPSGQKVAQEFYFAGRVELQSEDVSRRPLRFRFEMMDAAGILKNGEDTLRELVFLRG
jgi:hypothetical protein